MKEFVQVKLAQFRFMGSQQKQLQVAPFLWVLQFSSSTAADMHKIYVFPQKLDFYLK